MNKIKLLILLLSFNTYFYTFCPGGAMYIEPSGYEVTVENSSFTGYSDGTGIEAHGTGHTINNSDLSNNSMGVMLGSDNSSMTRTTIQSNSNQGVMNMGSNNQFFGNSISSNDVGIDNAGSNLTSYHNFVNNNTSGNLVGTDRSDYLFGFDGTFSCLGKIKDDLMGVFTAVQDVKATVTNIQEIAQAVADAIDTNGTFTMLNAILDKTCDVLDTVTSCCECETFITQADIPYTISESGVYCLSESIIGSGNAITISVNNVVLDLKDKEINGGSRCISIESAENVLVRNGTVRDATGTAVINAFSSSLVTLENLHILNGSSFGINLSDSSEVKVKNCIIDNCSNSGISIDATTNSCFTNIKISNCAAVFSDSGSPTDNLYVNCIGYSNSVGFILDASTNSILRNCIAYDSGANGFTISGDNAVLDQCVAINSTDWGFGIEANNTSLNKCFAKDGSSIGFNITGDNCTLTGCEAINNTLNRGFVIQSSNVILRDCVSEANTVGFDFFSSTTACKIISCCAIGNSSTGFSDSNADGRNRFFNNVAYENATQDYLNIIIAPILSAAAIDSTTGNYWMNIST